MSKVHTNMWANYYGKETIDTNTYGKSTGHSGSYSTNYQATGRELLTPDEVRMLENEKAILLIRGEKPVIDYKYDIMKHPNVKYTVDGNKKLMYEHGKVNNSVGTVTILESKEEIELPEVKEIEKITYELLSEEDVEEYIFMEEYENGKKQEKNKQ